MLAYSRGSNCLAGAAPLEHRVPAVVGSFCTNLDIAQWVEHRLTPNVAGSSPAIRLLCTNSSQPRVNQAGLPPSTRDRLRAFSRMTAAVLPLCVFPETAD